MSEYSKNQDSSIFTTSELLPTLSNFSSSISSSSSNSLINNDRLELGITNGNTDEYSTERYNEIKMFINDDRCFSLLRHLKLADYVTLLNAVFGFLSVVYSLKFSISEESQFIHVAFFCIIVGLVGDCIDGRLSRWKTTNSLLGREMNSLADLVSFAIAPATIAFSIGFHTNLDIICLAFYVVCVLARLARLNLTISYLAKDMKENNFGYFEGIPAPSSLFLILLMYFLVLKGKIFDFIPFGLYFDPFIFEIHPFILIFVFMGCGMISKRLRMPKLM